MPDKGQFSKLCNMTSCNTGLPADWYNHGSMKYYCKKCALRLNGDLFNHQDAMKLFGHELCTKGENKPTNN